MKLKSTVIYKVAKYEIRKPSTCRATLFRSGGGGEVICRAVKSMTPGRHASANINNASWKHTCNIIDITCGPALFSLFASRGTADHFQLVQEN